MSAVAQMREVRDLLRRWGFTVVEVPGWETRGRGTWRPIAALWHHTAGPRSGDAPSLRICTFGREGLRNALCNTYTSRSGVVYLVAALTAWHAGSGRLVTNSGSWGNEGENTGTGEPWTREHYAAQVALAAAICMVVGIDPSRHWDHKEHTSRKIDRAGISPARFRADVIAYYDLKTRPELLLEEDPMKLWNVAGDIYLASGVTAVHISERDDKTIGTVETAYGVKLEVWPGNADSFVDSHIISAGGGNPRPRQSTVTS